MSFHCRRFVRGISKYEKEPYKTLKKQEMIPKPKTIPERISDKLPYRPDPLR